MEKVHLSVMKATQGLKNNLPSRVQKLQGQGTSFVCLESEEFDNSWTAAVWGALYSNGGYMGPAATLDLDKAVYPGLCQAALASPWSGGEGQILISGSPTHPNSVSYAACKTSVM